MLNRDIAFWMAIVFLGFMVICLLALGISLAMMPSNTKHTIDQSFHLEWFEKDIANILYAKDRHDICYAVVASRQYKQEHIRSLATVPCDKVGL